MITPTAEDLLTEAAEHANSGRLLLALEVAKAAVDVMAARSGNAEVLELMSAQRLVRAIAELWGLVGVVGVLDKRRRPDHQLSLFPKPGNRP